MVYEPLRVPQSGPIDFTKLIKNISIRYLSSTRPEQTTLDEWIVLPLYQNNHDIPTTDDGKTSLLLATKNELQLIVDRWIERHELEKTISFRKPITKRKSVDEECMLRLQYRKAKEQKKSLKKQLAQLEKKKKQGSKKVMESN
ncbi:unnamed protein product [Auanema sp. JU1783]|nr:unnamed protein product [Auanema sp. JU1783]